MIVFAQLIGSAEILPNGDAVVGKFGTWTITYKAGVHGIDDSGSIRIAMRVASDCSSPQFDRPGDEGYTTAHTNADIKLKLSFSRTAHIRPWKPAITVSVADGALAPGDTITVIMGDTSGGGPGIRAQTFPESKFTYAVFVDCYGSGRYEMVEPSPHFRIVADRAARARIIAPSEVEPSKPFSVLVKLEDIFGNPATAQGETARLVGPIAGGARAIEWSKGKPALLPIRDLAIAQTGVARLRLEDTQFTASSNPIIVQARESRHLYWADLHGQSGATIGVGSLEEYFAFGRDAASLDILSHVANDFQITKEHWQETQDVVRQFHQPGRFVTFLGFEWSGTTPGGGDHNVYYLGDRGDLHRSSHWQVADLSDSDSDSYPLTHLLERYRDRKNVMIIPHIGGRQANLDFYDAERMPLIEVHSIHGTFEWFIEDAMRRGLPVGFTAGSDDHSGRPGASYPTWAGIHFGCRGGLTGVYAKELTREAIWEALQTRRCYATTGERMVLEVYVNGEPMGANVKANGVVNFRVRAIGTAPLWQVQIYRGLTLLYEHPLWNDDVNLNGLVIGWAGARTRHRNRTLDWSGRLTVHDGLLLDVEPWGFDTSLHGITARGDDFVEWQSTTVGDYDGLILRMEQTEKTRLSFASTPMQFDVELAELGARPRIIEGKNGVREHVMLMRKPLEPLPLETDFQFTDTPPTGTCAYWIRVLQATGDMAWSSPIYVTAAS